MTVRPAMLFLAALLLPTTSHAQSQECKDLAGIWNSDGKPATLPYLQIGQTGCTQINVAFYLQTDRGLRVDMKFAVNIDDQWNCFPGTKDVRRCVKARWRARNDILISEARYDEEDGCIHVKETYLAEPEVLKEEWTSSCEGRADEGRGWALMKRVRDPA